MPPRREGEVRVARGGGGVGSGCRSAQRERGGALYYQLSYSLRSAGPRQRWEARKPGEDWGRLLVLVAAQSGRLYC